MARYRLLPPDCADRESFAPFWKAKRLRDVPAKVRTRVGKRLALDVALELGMNSRTGRTLELTGTVSTEVVGESARLASAASAALDGVAIRPPLGVTEPVAPTDAELVAWVTGVLDRMRSQGAIAHPWFSRYRKEDGNRWSIWGGRPRDEGMPAFPRGRPAPAYPVVGGSGPSSQRENLDAVTSPKSWFAIWTSRALPVSAADAGLVVRRLLARLATDGLLEEVATDSGGQTYAIPPSAIVVSVTQDADLAAGRHLLVCDTCRSPVPGSVVTVERLTDQPCPVVRCRGRLRPEPLTPGFYRRLYASPDMRRVVAREHTSLLPSEERLDYERAFRQGASSPDAPNVLVATPTLELGIDIGDLSTVFLASLPRTVASYLQRVGRAGRLTGNALDLAFVSGRGEHLPRLGEPLSMINGAVRPPATYVSAEEILRRQFVAALVDEMARDPRIATPTRARAAIGSTEQGTFLARLIEAGETGGVQRVSAFLDAFEDVDPGARTRLEEWVQPVAGPGTSPLAAHVQDASDRWSRNVEVLTRRQATLAEVLPELEVKANSPAATDDDRRAHRSAQGVARLTRGQLSALRSEYWIGVLEEYGLLPNYMLLGDHVLLDVGMSWTDPDSGKFESSYVQIQRAGSDSARELAPGATFYAWGLQIEIDAIDLGMDGESIRRSVLCPACGYVADLVSDIVGQSDVASAPNTCPRCGTNRIADTGQILEVVEMRRVSAEIRRDEAAISERSDERVRTSFQVVVAADVAPSSIVHRWFADPVGLGCTYLRDFDLRWINLGKTGHGVTRTISAQDVPGTLFRVCEGCGKVDTDTGRNKAYEHRAWCRFRTSQDEHTRSIALTRTLRTEGILLRLPNSVTLGDDFAVPSLAAALLLGLREQLGGDPDHLRVESVIDPTLSDGTDNHDALLLHDTVPGGTGYLTHLADPKHLWALLCRAYEAVRACECRTEDRLACHRCLLPFAPWRSMRRVSRASAERHLRALLDVDEGDTTPAEPSWQITEEAPPEDNESVLEQRFRKLFVTRLRAAGAAITETPGVWGNTVRFTLAGAPRQWTLAPQVNVRGTRPDFILETNDASIPRVAIFTDGRAYHATALHNRLADDAVKRRDLRDAGYAVIAVTARDVSTAEQDTQLEPAWFQPELVRKLMMLPEYAAQPPDYESLRTGPIDWLLRWVVAPSPDGVRHVARAVPLFMNQGATPHLAADELPLDEIGRLAVLGEPIPVGTRQVVVRRLGDLVVVAEAARAEIRTAVVLDDRLGPDAVTDEGAYAESWREWLRISNALTLRDWQTVISTVSLVIDEGGSAVQAVAPVHVGGAWQSVLDTAGDDAERALITALAELGIAHVPSVGMEGPDGIPLDLAWPERLIAVCVHPMAEEDRRDLEGAGWMVLDPDPAAIAAAVGARSAGRTEGS